MSHTIEKIDHYVSGDTLVLEFVVHDGDSDDQDARKNLSNADIDWWLAKRDARVVDTDTDGISADVTDPLAGELEITLSAGATTNLNGVYDERLRIVSESGGQNTWIGRFNVTQAEE